jgi:hypothetical protein
MFAAPVCPGGVITTLFKFSLVPSGLFTLNILAYEVGQPVPSALQAEDIAVEGFTPLKLG